MMNDIFEIIKYTIPAIIVFLTAFVVLKQMVRTSEQKLNTEIILGNQKIITPLKLQAYERLILLLERLSPDALITRLSKPNQTNKQLHKLLLQTIRSEFEHNLSQQVYVSIKSWSVIKGAKENLIKLINSLAEKVDPNKPSIILSKEIIDSMMNMEKPPTHVAIDFLKEEIQVFL